MVAAIFTAEDKHHPFPGLPGLTAPERIVLKHWPAATRLGFPSSTETSVHALAEVNHGRWIVRCPWCATAQNASADDHRFFCTECSNGAAGGQWITVEWPEDREEIEAALGCRPLPANRNWVPGESVAELWRDNADHEVA